VAQRQPPTNTASNVALVHNQVLTDLATLLRARPDLSVPLLKVATKMESTPFGDVTVRMQDGKPVLIETVVKEKLT
jgi:hypothetical protein